MIELHPFQFSIPINKLPSSELQLDMILPLILGEGWTLAAFAPLGPLLETPLGPPDAPLGGPPQAPDPDEILSLSIETLKELFESPASEGLSFLFRRLWGFSVSKFDYNGA